MEETQHLANQDFYLGAVCLRVPELLRARDLTAYRFATDSGSRLGMFVAYCMSRRGAFRCLSAEHIDAQGGLLDAEPGGLFESPARRRTPR